MESCSVISPEIMEADTVTSILPCVDELEKFSAMPLEPTAMTVPSLIVAVPEQSRAPFPPCTGPSI